MARPLQALVDPDALQHNLAVLREKAPRSRIMAMVKANAYGHGLGQMGHILETLGIEALGVACIEEALLLREHGVQSEIVLMEGFFEPHELEFIQSFHFTSVIHHEEQIRQLECRARGTDVLQGASPIPVWLKINTGMNRLGIPATQAKAYFERLRVCRGVSWRGWMTHFACAEEGDGVVVREQQRLFEKAIQELPGARSLANSAAIFTRPDSHRDWIRPGLALYGASPFVEGTGASLGLKPVMHLISRLLSIQPVQAGDAVGYGHAFRFTRPGHLGIVAVGYGDGYPRGAPYGTPVLLHTAQRKIEVPLVGRVSMDMLAVDLSDIPLSELEIGQPVTLWGSDLPVEGVARRLGTVAYELLAGVSGRVPIIVQSNDGGPR